jgi:hypothetical protein
VTGTGTRQPTRCGKGPTAVGESVMVLPGIPRNGCPQGLAGKGSDLQCGVQSRRSSRRRGKPATGRRAAVQGPTRIPSRRNNRFLPFRASWLIGLCRREVSGRTALEGKPDVSKGTCPVWEGALGNQRKRRYTERPGGDSAPPPSCRKTRMAPSFYPHSFMPEQLPSFLNLLLPALVFARLGVAAAGLNILSSGGSEHSASSAGFRHSVTPAQRRWMQDLIV